MKNQSDVVLLARRHLILNLKKNNSKGRAADARTMSELQGRSPVPASTTTAPAPAGVSSSSFSTYLERSPAGGGVVYGSGGIKPKSAGGPPLSSIHVLLLSCIILLIP